MSGLNMEPGQSYQLADRFTCGVCMTTPRVVKALADGGQVHIELCCHGETFKKTYAKGELGKNITVFTNDAADDVSHLVIRR